MDAGHSLTSPGYQKLSSGLILQWGYGYGYSYTPFPVPFPNACLYASCSSEAGYPNPQKANVSRFGVSSWAVGANVYWLAIGY